MKLAFVPAVVVPIATHVKVEQAMEVMLCAWGSTVTGLHVDVATV